MFFPYPSAKYFPHDKYVFLFVEYFDFDRKDIRVSILSLFSLTDHEVGGLNLAEHWQ